MSNERGFELSWRCDDGGADSIDFKMSDDCAHQLIAALVEANLAGRSFDVSDTRVSVEAVNETGPSAPGSTPLVCGGCHRPPDECACGEPDALPESDCECRWRGTPPTGGLRQVAICSGHGALALLANLAAPRRHRGSRRMSETLREVERAVARIEESRGSHQAWADHIPACDHCQEHGPPPYIQSLEEHRQIVTEYDAVLVVLRRALLAATDPTPDEGCIGKTLRDEVARVANIINEHCLVGNTPTQTDLLFVRDELLDLVEDYNEIEVRS